MKFLLLDIDGVLNGHERHENSYCGIHPEMVNELDRIVGETDCKIILISAWRYMILGGSMTLKGFTHMLATHGASRRVCEAFHGHTGEDGSIDDPHDRARLCVAYLAAFRYARAVVLDDLDAGYAKFGIPFVQTDGKMGLTSVESNRVIEILNG